MHPVDAIAPDDNRLERGIRDRADQQRGTGRCLGVGEKTQRGRGGEIAARGIPGESSSPTCSITVSAKNGFDELRMAWSMTREDFLRLFLPAVRVTYDRPRAML